jgi:hypothetical protein
MATPTLWNATKGPGGVLVLQPVNLLRLDDEAPALCLSMSLSEGCMTYVRFLAMITISTLAMFGLMYLNTFSWDHIFFSETRSYMALYMGATMAVIMLAFMMGMYANRAANIAIFASSALVFAVSLFLLRSQTTVQDTSYMKAMIPHHSIAILTSERAEISDPRVRNLADEIIKAQRLEIDEMKALIADLDGGPKATPEIDGM